MRESAASLAAYERLLASIGERADDIGGRPLVTHAPHVGSGYRGLVVVGQALSGWPDDWTAAFLATPEGRAQALRATLARNASELEPMGWVLTSDRLNKPWWKTVRLLAEALEPEADVEWHGRFAWVNLYPAAPILPSGNPTGALREAQNPHVADLLTATLDALDARTVVALVGTEWWPTGSSPSFAQLVERPRPLMRSGVLGRRRWVVGWHPNGANRRGIGPEAYVALLTAELGGLAGA
jgi:hypothetical protein